jgi:hypothetical protein
MYKKYLPQAGHADMVCKQIRQTTHKQSLANVGEVLFRATLNESPRLANLARDLKRMRG